MKNILTPLLFLSASVLFAQFQGPVPAITNGYGANGSFTVAHIDIRNDNNSFLKPISLFYPEGTTEPVPTIFYSHGFLSSDTTFHIETLRHIASKGYAVVFVPYRAAGVTIAERYITLFDGFVKAARTNPSIIDTTQVGFYGQSFGGGATPRIAYRAFTENNWGTNGKFMFCSAPWYSFELGSNDLPNFPTDCNMLTVLYNDDFTNDHRLGMDVFRNIAINDSIKDCLIVYSDTIGEYTYEADHTLPPQYTGSGEFDALDYYVTFRLIDALADYSFTGNPAAKEVALGNGSIAQLDMGGQLTNLTQSDSPTPAYPESIYTNPCGDQQNERQAFCPAITTINDERSEAVSFSIYPNPSNWQITLGIPPSVEGFKIVISSMDGKIILATANTRVLNIGQLNSGMYLVYLHTDRNKASSRLLIKN